MKTKSKRTMDWLPKKILFAIAIIVMAAIAVDAAVHASHVMVFLALIMLGILFFTLYEEFDKHRLGVSISCLILGSIYLAFYPIDFTWWRFTLYSGTLYFAAALFFASWIVTRHARQRKHAKVKKPAAHLQEGGVLDMF